MNNSRVFEMVASFSMRRIYFCYVLFIFLFPSVAVAQPCGGDRVRVSDGKLVAMDELVNDSLNGSVILLGERHGVKAHPQAAACFLTALSEARKLVLAVEHISSAEQARVDAYRNDHPEFVDGLGKTLRWWKSGWPTWKVYEPLFRSAWMNRVPLLGADIPNPSVSIAEIEARLGAEDARRVRQEWTTDMERAHCNMLEAGQASQLGDRQIARDMAMASIVKAAGTEGATVLFYAGRLHVRKDRSVPLQLEKTGSSSVISVALQETKDGSTIVDRDKILRDAKGHYDYIWFIGEAENKDNCEKLVN